MPVTSDRPGPYTSPKSITDLVYRHRDRGLPSVVDADTLLRAGVSESLVARTLQSLQALDLIGEDGRITEVFEGLRLAPQADFQAAMKKWLDAAYADVLQFVDPATDSETSVRDAFRNYRPVGQQDRMVTLFLRLYEAAGVSAPKSDAPKPRPRPPAARELPRGVKSVVGGGVMRTPATTVGRSTQVTGGNMPPAIAGLLHSLPAEGSGWTKETRDRFLTTFGAVIDFCFPIISEAALAADENQNEE